MKKIFTRFAFTVLTAGAFLSTQAQGFVKTIDNGGDEYGNVVNVADGNNYIVAGSTNKVGAGSYDAMLLKIDSAGNALWEKQFGGAGFDAGRYALHTSDGGYLLVGSSSSYGSSSDVFVVKTDADGNLSWSKTFGTDSSDTGFRAAEGSDGYLIGGQTYGAAAPNNTRADMFLAKIDLTGTLVWSKSYGSQFGNENLRDIVYIGPEWAVVGNSTLGLVGASDGIFFVIDSAGAVVGNFLAGGTSDDDFRALIPGADGAYIIGSTRSYGVTGDDISVTKYNVGGGVPTHAWVKTYGLPNGSESVTSAKLIPDENQILISGLLTGNGYPADEGFLLLVDTGGTPLIGKEIGSTGSEVIMDIAFNHGMIGIGYTNSYGGTQNDVLAISVDQTGNAPCAISNVTFPVVTQHDSAIGPVIAEYNTLDLPVTATTVNATANGYTQTMKDVCNPNAIAEVNNSMSFEVYPNPATDVVNVTVYSQNNTEAQISICNYMGQAVQSFNAGITTGKNSFALNLGNLSSGMYYVRINNAGNQVVKPFVIN